MKTILITGANRGIGLEMAARLHNRGDTVITACRRSSAELDQLGLEVIEGIDVGSDDSVRARRGRASARSTGW